MSENAGAVWGLLILAGIGYASYRGYEEYEVNKSPTLEQQRICAEQADKFYKQAGAITTSSSDNNFFDHFNIRLGRCFVEITEQNYDAHSTSLDLYDAFEGKEYGSFLSFYNNGETKVPMCKFVGADGQDHSCKSEGEFTAAIKSYIP